MSDNNVCPKRGKPYSYVNNVCPKCGKPYSYVGDVFGDPRDFVCQCYLSERPQIWYKISNDSANLYTTISSQQAEIARLKAALEQDEKEIVAEHKRYRDMVEQRDEVRRWARKYYQLYLIERQNYLDTFSDGDEWDEV